MSAQTSDRGHIAGGMPEGDEIAEAKGGDETDQQVVPSQPFALSPLGPASPPEPSGRPGRRPPSRGSSGVAACH